MITGSKDGWRFIDTGINNGFSNMAIDEAMLDAHLRDLVPPTLRIYRWSPPALSLGYFQSINEDVNKGRCSELGIDIVRRLTGGRAVLHQDELTYSIVASEKHGLPESIEQSYKFLNKGLIAAYRILGLEVCLVSYDRGISSAACFTSAGSADLTFQGRKIAGSAQYRKGDTVLQHGSLPISLDPQLFSSILKFPSISVRDTVLSAFSQKVTSISEILGSQVGWQELKVALFEGFQQALSTNFYEDTLTLEEIDLSEKLVKEKYNTFDWSYYGRCESDYERSAITAIT
jgi:lipoate-protein ligase A